MTAAALIAWGPVLAVVLAAGAVAWIGVSRTADDAHVRWLGAIGLAGAGAISAVVWWRMPTMAGSVDREALLFNILLSAALLAVVASARNGEMSPWRCALVLLSGASAMTAAAARDLVALVMSVQAVSMGAALLMAYRSRESDARLAVRELVPAVACGTLTLYGVALIYALTGTTRFETAMMRLAASSLDPSGLMLVALGLVLVSLAWITMVVPFRIWIAGSAGDGALGLVAFVSGAWVCVRLMLTVFEPLRADWQPPMATASGLLMIAGTVGGLGQSGVRRVAAHLTLGQVGLVLAGVVVGGEVGRSAALLVLFGHGLTTLAIGTAATALLASTTPEDDVWDVRGLGYRRPLMAGLLAAALTQLGTLPPGAGFVARWVIMQRAMGEGLGTLGLVIAVTGIVSMFIALRLVFRIYRHGSPSPRGSVREPDSALIVVGVCVVLAVLAGVMSGPWLLVISGGDGPLF